MKIAISGKGGTGKSTISGLLAHYFKNDGYKVLAIDADPDANLADVLGVRVERTVGDMREFMLENVSELPPDTNKESVFQAKIYGVIEEFKSKGKQIIGVAMGRLGTMTRVFGPQVGSYLTYASLEKGKESAEGQLTLENMRTILSILGTSKE